MVCMVGLEKITASVLFANFIDDHRNTENRYERTRSRLGFLTVM